MKFRSDGSVIVGNEVEISNDWMGEIGAIVD
jgi:hypothetical protein